MEKKKEKMLELTDEWERKAKEWEAIIESLSGIQKSVR